MKALPPTSVGNPYEEGSPGDLQSFVSYFNATAQQRAGINSSSLGQFLDGKENCNTLQSLLLDESGHYHHMKSAISLLSVLSEDNVSPVDSQFKLQDGLRVPAFVAHSAVGLLKLSEPKCLQNGNHTSGFHSLFVALQEPECQLSRLDLTGCCLGPQDLNCLGEALRNSRRLKSLRLAKLKRYLKLLK